jgi:hypothetical protein
MRSLPKSQQQRRERQVRNRVPLHIGPPLPSPPSSFLGGVLGLGRRSHCFLAPGVPIRALPRDQISFL